MSLLLPTPGQVIDRMAIVELKLKASPSNEGLKNELEDLRSWLIDFPCGVVPLAKKSLDELHSKLWELENAVRREREPVTLGAIAKRIALLNDERNRLIQEIDKAYGSSSVEDKVYS